MTALTFSWLEFGVCALLIGAAGPELSRSGDIIADKTGISGNWIGLVLLGAVTSLPELVTGISSVTWANEPNIAVGDVFGSCVFNLLILVVVDFMYREKPVYQRAHQGHILSAGFGVPYRLCWFEPSRRRPSRRLRHRPCGALYADSHRPLSSRPSRGFHL